jgi:O-antigen ligase
MTLFIFLLVIIITIIFPIAGLVLASQSYLIRSSIVDGSNLVSFNESDVLLGALLPITVFFIIIFKERKKILNIKLNVSDLLFILLGIVLLFGSLYASNQYLAIEITLRYFVLGISFYFIIRLSSYNKDSLNKNIEQFINTFWLLGITLGILAILNPNEGTNRMAAGIAHPVPYSYTVGIALIISFYFLLKKYDKNIVSKSTRYFSFFFLMFVLISTNTRGTIAASLISIMYILLNSIINKQIRVKELGKTIILVFLLIVGMFFLVESNPKVINNTLDKFNSLFEETVDQSALERQNAYGLSYYLFSLNPFLGSGTGSFADSSHMEYAHNLLFEILAENGILGLVILFLLIIYFLYWTMKTKATYYNQSTRLIILALLIYTFIEAQFSLTLWMNKTLFMVCALFVSTITIQKDSSDN